MADILGDIGDFLALAAPTLASAAGGPLAGLAVTKIEEWLGITPGSAKDDPGGFKAALEKAMASPEQIVQLRKIDTDFKQFCLDNELQIFKAEVADRDSARQREAAVKDHMPAVLTILTTLGFFGLLAAMMHWDVPPQNKDMFNIMLGALGTAWGACVSYFVGSSKGSTRKDDTIAALSK